MLKKFFLFIFISPISLAISQYTDQINSNRPGVSIGAFSVGTGVIQLESGIEYRNYKHKGYNNSISKGKVAFLSLRYGFLKEQLELTYDGAYMFDELENKASYTPLRNKREGFLKNFIGLKYLVYDPFKKERKTNFYSWNANNKFKIRDLIPAVSLSFGANISHKKDNNYPYNDVFEYLFKPFLFQTLILPRKVDPFFSGRATLATQSHFLGTWVFVTNYSYDRILSEYIEKSYILTLTHTFDPKWSIYIETQGVSSEIYQDQLFKMGTAYLMNDNTQIELTIGSNVKDTPSSFIFNSGVSYRFDFHKDINPEIKKSENNTKKAFKKEEKNLKKSIKESKKATKRARKKTN